MDLSSAKTIKELLLRYDTKPSKLMGQNFLVHAPTLAKIIEAANLQSTDTVLEVGPGIGTLTQELAKKAGEVIAIEKDRTMVEILKENLKNYKNVEIIYGDVLLTTHYSLPTNYKVVANIPYYLTSPLIRKLLESASPPSEIILMIQKEVAQRICAKPPNMSILAVSVQFYADAKIISKVPKECFWPTPKVDSAIIKIIPHNQVRRGPTPADFFKVVKAGFIQPRKQLGNNFSKALKKDRSLINKWLAKNNINPLQRAETLSIQDWINLTKSYQQPKHTT